MDIIITASQGGGKTHTALAIIKGRLGAKHFKDIEHDVLTITSSGTIGDNASRLAQRFREAKPEAVLFDGSITSAEELLTAVSAMQKYRQQTGRPNVLAIYCVQDGRHVILTNGVKAVAPAFDAEAMAQGIQNSIPPSRDRTLEILDDLRADVLGEAARPGGDLGLKRAAEAEGLISKEVFFYTKAPMRLALGDLDVDDRPKMHEFLLKLLREYEG